MPIGGSKADQHPFRLTTIPTRYILSRRQRDRAMSEASYPARYGAPPEHGRASTRFSVRLNSLLQGISQGIPEKVRSRGGLYVRFFPKNRPPRTSLNVQNRPCCRELLREFAKKRHSHRGTEDTEKGSRASAVFPGAGKKQGRKQFGTQRRRATEKN
jgi:hypothetical protein